MCWYFVCLFRKTIRLNRRKHKWCRLNEFQIFSESEKKIANNSAEDKHWIMFLLFSCIFIFYFTIIFTLIIFFMLTFFLFCCLFFLFAEKNLYWNLFASNSSYHISNFIAIIQVMGISRRDTNIDLRKRPYTMIEVIKIKKSQFLSHPIKFKPPRINESVWKPKKQCSWMTVMQRVV